MKTCAFLHLHARTLIKVVMELMCVQVFKSNFEITAKRHTIMSLTLEQPVF